MRENRNNDQMREINITPNFLKFATGSALIEFGNTKVITAVNAQQSVPSFLDPEKEGWLTAEYSLLPASTPSRVTREASRGKVGGRTHEIQRLIGRSLRAAIDLNKIPGITMWVDCDVIQADGGTRTASITGSYVSLVLAVQRLMKDGIIIENPIIGQIAAISVGIVEETILLDLDYSEDSKADVDMNIVMNRNKEFIEIQGTSENRPFNRDALSQLLDYGEKGIMELFTYQDLAIKDGK